MAETGNAHAPRPQKGRCTAHVEGRSRRGTSNLGANGGQAQVRQTTGDAGTSRWGRGSVPLPASVQIHATTHLEEMADVIHW